MQETFLRLLMTLAQACKFELSKDLMSVYDGVAENKGYDLATAAVRSFIIERRTNDPFPSIRDLVDKIEPTLLPEDESVMAAVRALAAVRKFGRTNPVQARGFIGELGWRGVEEMGGWSVLCTNLTTSNMSTYQSQLTKICLAVWKRVKNGVEGAPGLPRPSMPRQIGSIIASLTPRVSRETV